MIISWLLCCQSPNNVRYITSELSYPVFLNYYKFLDYIHSFNIQDFENFKNYLDRFHTILVDLQTGEWKLYEEKRKEATFEELWKMNASEIEIRQRQEQLKPGSTKPIVERLRSSINTFVNERHKTKQEKDALLKVRQRNNQNLGQKDLYRGGDVWNRKIMKKF